MQKTDARMPSTGTKELSFGLSRLPRPGTPMMPPSRMRTAVSIVRAARQTDSDKVNGNQNSDNLRPRFSIRQARHYLHIIRQLEYCGQRFHALSAIS